MSDQQTKASIAKWVSHKLRSDIERRVQRIASAYDVAQVAVMPDIHIAGDVCNGIVIASENRIYPQAVGGDIGCGYLAVALESPIAVIDQSLAARLFDGLYRAVPLNKHASRREYVSDVELSNSVLRKASLRDGAVQLGTLGRGNHFVELQQSLSGQFWLLIHSGSRAIGQAISNFHLRKAGVDSNSGLKFVDSGSIAGHELLIDFKWARNYAAANRESILKQIRCGVLDRLGFEVDDRSLIHLDHNHVQNETDGGKSLWVHRKGAQRLLPGQKSVIPGSMATKSYLVQGRGCRSALNSCSHGAGRNLSRTEARKRLSPRRLRREMSHVWFDQRKLFRLVDESPSAYKDIRKVMKAQKELVKIVDTLEPVLSFKGN